MGDMSLQLGDRDAGGVGGDDDRRSDQRVDFAVNFGLDVDILRHVFDNQFRAVHSLDERRHQAYCACARWRRLDFETIKNAFRDIEHAAGAIDRSLRHVIRSDLDTAAGKPRRDTRAHRPQSDEGDALDHHAAFAEAAPAATLKAGRAAIAADQRSRSGNDGRSILKSMQRFRIGAQAISAMVNLPSARKSLPARWPWTILSCATRSLTSSLLSAVCSSGFSLAFLKAAR